MNRVLAIALLSLLLHWSEFVSASTEVEQISVHCAIPAQLQALKVPISSVSSFDSCSLTTLTELIEEPLADNTTIIFLPGKHLMPINATFSVTNVQKLQLTGQGSSWSKSLPEIDCQGSKAAFQLINIVSLTISNLNFSNCGKLISYKNTDLQRMASLFLANITNLFMKQLEIANGLGYGLYGVNIVGNSIITQSHFFNNTRGGNALLVYTDLDQISWVRMHHLLVEDSSFTKGHSNCTIDPQSDYIGAGLSVQLLQTQFSVNITLLRTNASGNIARKGTNFQFSSLSDAPNLISLQDCVSQNGTALFSGGVGFEYTQLYKPPLNPAFFDTSSISKTLILLNNSKFTDGKGGENPSSLSENPSGAIVVLFYREGEGTLLHVVSIQNCDISNNIGNSGVGFYSQVSGSVPMKGFVEVKIVGSSFRNNTCTIFSPNRLNIIYLVDIDDVMLSNVSVYENYGTGISAVNSHVSFEGPNILSNNSAYNGGGIALHGDSFIILKPDTTIVLASNKASNIGGGIYVAQFIDTTVTSKCFFQLSGFSKQEIPSSRHLQFINNSAGLAGDDLYGGFLEMCSIETIIGRKGYQIFPLISDIKYSKVDVSSKPLRVCVCNETTKQINCSEFSQSITTYPGGLINISAIAVGQLFHHPSGSPSVVYASLLPTYPDQGNIPVEMQTQSVGRYCSPLIFRVDSRNANEMIILSIEKSLEIEKRNDKMISKAENWFNTPWLQVLDIFAEIPIYINVTLLPCPLGFELTLEGVCSCASIFTEHSISCSIDSNTLHREPPMWIGWFSNSDNDSSIYMVHPNCPYDYCITDSIEISLRDSDKQCAANRTGILCGACRVGLSSTLGGSQCKQCSNLYILLLIPFALAGLLLVCLLLGMNLTVTVGTMNGMLFYANIVRENHTSLFPLTTNPNIMTVFIAWLNLDFGVPTCFYNGMDMYAKSWLQFVFPVYIWLLTGLIIVACRYSMFVSKLCGKNIVQVLVTLFLLSHSKLQRAIIMGISFTVVKQSNNHSDFVWLLDPTVNYVQGKHIYLFIMCLVFFVLLFLPYTLFILFGPCLLARTSYRLLSCFHKLKPFFDAYFGPYKDRHRHWTGLLLFVRALLVVLSAVNVFGDPSVNLLAASIVSYILIVLFWQSGGVYKVWVLNYLECFFLLNLGLLSTVSLYIRLSGGVQLVVTYISCGSAFIVFIGIILYHILVYTPINIAGRKCTASKLSFLRRFHGSLSTQESSMTSPRHSDFDDYIDRLVDSDHDSECDRLSNDSLSVNSDTEIAAQDGEERREVSSMFKPFNDMVEPTIELSTIWK